MAEILRSCTTCHVKPRRNGQRTCAECHTAYQKNYRGAALRRLEDRFFRKGFEAFRSAAADKFRALPLKSEFNGLVAAEIIRQIPQS
jgi:hypothetical protein